jgi:26S proteasome regulatory subunit N12
LQIGLIEAGLLIPTGEPKLEDLVVARMHNVPCYICIALIQSILGDILEIGAFWSIRTKDVPSFDRYFSQLQTFYTDYRLVFNTPTFSLRVN